MEDTQTKWIAMDVDCRNWFTWLKRRDPVALITSKFKAGAMNALIRVSSEISDGAIILNLDCDMYANNADSIKEALFFFMDEERGHHIAFVQHPQCFNNIIKNDLYGNSIPVVNKEWAVTTPHYIVAPAAFTGERVFAEASIPRNMKDHRIGKRGRMMTGQFMNWRKHQKFLLVVDMRRELNGETRYRYTVRWGVAPPTLDIALVQWTRWSDGMFQIFFSKYCPFIYGHNKIKLGAQIGHCVYLLWAPTSLPHLYYTIALPFSLVQGIPLFPEVSRRWFIPFAHVLISKNLYNIAEALLHGSTFKAWWNSQRMWMIRGTTSFFFGFIDCIVRQLGLSQTTFRITAKVVTDDALTRYQQEMMDFRGTSIMFAVISTLAMVNVLGLVGGAAKVFCGVGIWGS
ncbi:hypothetical protein F3Y22_tig00110458pilonHSYRG00448 [Hibiscus syriacus]|uniref:Uncharacterized protein n=1 Tax=Hibiscus syriacus TaxID=106335 RepID=A0A6A3AKA8_HIBSY|nr:hypothetical protein F3Y22_tig00110458pilonHSYRG00448 [Hibiscus syriacus]